MRVYHLMVIGLVGASSVAFAAETVTYTYDAKGRLVRVVHSGGPAANADKQYSYDKADNRKKVIVANAQ
ncbi:hypothetical protein NYR55_09390 [Sphingomonas sp. BGYR3]|uniref:hypothetical protein n=1 Tax=Sphingomonas sp. BGYR3 TaxID=2975483 RepID=UPI0021A4967C|nr:hypothetical protein [Sphingomonas sp. BGYR3]MDG5488827.1 hypothetical protein [Sphingomonas sp. BGYR3]